MTALIPNYIQRQSLCVCVCVGLGSWRSREKESLSTREREGENHRSSAGARVHSSKDFYEAQSRARDCGICAGGSGALICTGVSVVAC